jgi:Ca-activated chloride channel family protein
MTTTVTLLDTPPTSAPDDGFGALSTAKGNLPLEKLDVRLSTTGLAIHTELIQTFRNPYAEPLEATYVFPLPDRAAVTSLRM